MRKEEEVVLLRAEGTMVRLTCGVKLRDRKRTSELMSMFGLCDDIVTLVAQSRLRRYRHVMRKDVTYGVRRLLDVDITVYYVSGRPRLERRQAVEKYVLKMDYYLRTCWIELGGG